MTKMTREQSYKLLNSDRKFYRWLVFYYIDEFIPITCNIQFHGSQKYTKNLFEEINLKIYLNSAPDVLYENFKKREYFTVYTIDYTFHEPEDVKVEYALIGRNKLDNSKIGNIFNNEEYQILKGLLTDNKYHQIMLTLPDKFYSVLANQIALIENIHNLQTNYNGDIPPIYETTQQNNFIGISPGAILDPCSKSWKIIKNRQHIKDRISVIQNKLLTAKNVIKSLFENNKFNRKQLKEINKQNREYLDGSSDQEYKYSRNAIDVFIAEHWNSLIEELLWKGAIKRCKRCESLFDRYKSYSIIKEPGRSQEYQDSEIKYHLNNKKELDGSKWNDKHYCNEICRTRKKYESKHKKKKSYRENQS